jgi:hypothetical protein
MSELVVSRGSFTHIYGLMPKADQDRESGIFLEKHVRKTERALIKDRASIRTQDANMTTPLTQSDRFIYVLGHDGQFSAS